MIIRGSAKIALTAGLLLAALPDRTAFAEVQPELIAHCTYNTDCIVVTDPCGQPQAIALAWARDYASWLKVERTRGTATCPEGRLADSAELIARCEQRQCRLRSRSRPLR
jgi:hypothetical protein